MRTMETWGGRSKFSYTGSVKSGTTIAFGEGFRYAISVDAAQYARLLAYFRGRTVKAGTVRGGPGCDSLGDWLTQNVTPTATASYVAAILVDEGYADRVERDSTVISFHGAKG